MAAKPPHILQRELVLLRASETPPGEPRELAFRYTSEGIRREFDIPGISRILTELRRANLVTTFTAEVPPDSPTERRKLVAVCATPDGLDEAASILRRFRGLELPIILRDYVKERRRAAAGQLHNALGMDFGSASIRKLLDSSLAVDEPLLKLKHIPSSVKGLRNLYQAVLTGHAAGLGISAHQFASLVRDAPVSSFLDGLGEEVGLTISVDTNLESIRFETSDSQIGLANPTLLWECSCHLPDALRGDTQGIPCRLHTIMYDEEIDARFHDSLICIEYGGTKILWRNDPVLWPPSIDSLWMCKTILSSRTLDGVRSILDVGTGTGFLGIHLARRSAQPLHVEATDWLLTPLWTTRLNAELNGLTDQVQPHLGPNFSFLGSHPPPVDAIICNPPYLPLLGHQPLAASHTVAGTDLLQFLVSHGSKLAPRVILGCSELALDELNAAVQAKPSAHLEPLGPWLDVPFRVVHTYEHPEYLAKLRKPREDGGRSLGYRPGEPFAYWHRIRVFEISYNA